MLINELPPSATIVCPVIHPASSKHSAATAPPMSAGVPARPIGFQPSRSQESSASCASFGRAFTMLSSVIPAQTAFTVMPRFANVTA